MYSRTKSENFQTATEQLAKSQSSKQSDPYKPQKGFTASPFDVLYAYQGDDVEICDRKDVQNLYKFAVRFHEKIPGELKLDHLTYQIRTEDLGFVRRGLIAYRIRRERLYKQKYDNFGDYCRVELGRSRSYMDRLIEAARVFMELMTVGCKVLPWNESQCRELAKFTGSELTHRWNAIVKTLEPHQITASSIRGFLSGEDEENVEPEDLSIKLPGYQANYLAALAIRVCMGVQELVVMTLDEIFQPPKTKANWRDFEKEEIWQVDLDEIVDRGQAFWEHLQNNPEYRPNTS